MEDLRITDGEGRYLPARIEWLESAGPVSPRYQYRTRVLITAGEGEPLLSYDDQRDFHEGKPRARLVFTRELSADEYRALWRELVDAGLLAAGADLVGPENRSRIGASFNFFEAQVGGTRVRCDYLLSSLRAEAAAPCRRVIELLENLKRFAPAAGDEGM